MPSRTSSDSNLTPVPQRTPPLQHSISNQSARTGHSYHRPSCQQEDCEHGLLSPHASRPTSSDSNRQFRSGNAQHTPTHLAYEPQHSESVNGGAYGGRHAGERDFRHGILGDALADGVFGSGVADRLNEENDGKNGRQDGDDEDDGAPLSTTQWLAKKHGVKGKRVMYVLSS